MASCEWEYSPCGYNEQQITYYDNSGVRTGYGCVSNGYYLDNSDMFFIDDDGEVSQIKLN